MECHYLEPQRTLESDARRLLHVFRCKRCPKQCFDFNDGSLKYRFFLISQDKKGRAVSEAGETTKIRVMGNNDRFGIQKIGMRYLVMFLGGVSVAQGNAIARSKSGDFFRCNSITRILEKFVKI
ncbi:hypothetical protein JTE90_024415 [Oedothorax gibbosus]|uniref:Uncharacterized protein n=1 Tax=Oedothorax gibbosus TaxID=931172 RepID=A0AAV6TP82_9ARAC|nr:hypothetical protein JTE90_024415 [Oedothorax gibbosus]